MIGTLSLPSAAEVLQSVDQIVRSGDSRALAPLPTGFHPLDRYLDGGFRPGELILVGGAPGVGKTTLTLQMARNLVARSTTACAYVCYEHSETFLLQRLIALEAFLAREKPSADAISLNDIRELVLGAARASSNGHSAGLSEALHERHVSSRVLESLQQIGQRLYLFTASRDESGVATLRRQVRELKRQHGPRVVLFVDYLQKVPVFPAAPNELEATTRIVNELKDLALAEDVPVVAVAAADREGLRAARLRLHHLRGSSALAYEADVALILNNKFRVVGKRAITFNPHQAQTFRQFVVCSVEKNRSGIDQVDLEFRGFFANAAFDPAGKVVAEELVDERIDE